MPGAPVGLEFHPVDQRWDEMVKRKLAACSIALAAVTVGCARQPDAVFVSSQQVQKLRPELQKQVLSILKDRCGTPQKPKLLGNSVIKAAHLRRGEAVYSRYCVACHGVTGDGNGVAAPNMIPKPRDYRPGTFKFTSTTFGAKPLREDLLRTVRRGIRGTSMPSFALLPPDDQDAVIDYVLVLTHRGELETELAAEAEFNDSIERPRIGELITTVLDRWEAARAQIVYPVTPMPQFTAALVEEGKKAFLTKACIQCHGDDGRGQLATNVGVDAWGNPTKAADLTSGMLRGGTEPLDLYRHIEAGINGTPMPSFHTNLQKEPETIWKLVAYVLKVADERRQGIIPDSGLLQDGILKPLPGVKPAGVTKVAGQETKSGQSAGSARQLTRR
jgi:mono/diheme cytochrome c family protein